MSQGAVARIHWNLGSGYSAQRNSNAFGANINAVVKAGLLSKKPCIGVVLPKPAEHREMTASDEDIEALLVG